MAPTKGLLATIAALALGAGAISACGSEDGSAPAPPTGSESVKLDPSELTTEITNPWWPMAPGSRWIYREEDPEGDKRVVVTVTSETRRIANGVEARVVRDVVTQGGEPLEVTDDWYAQDAEGNVWYLGEETAEHEDGKVVSREGSFEAGVDGAEPGIAMPADPRPGLTYRQEYLEGEAEDYATVLGFALQAEVPFGRFDKVLQTEDVNPLGEPQQVENKLYAKGVGPILTLDLTGVGREELVSYAAGAGAGE